MKIGDPQVARGRSALTAMLVAAAMLAPIALRPIAGPALAQDQRPVAVSKPETEHPLRPMFSAFIRAVEDMFVHQDRLAKLNWRSYAEGHWPIVAGGKTAAEIAAALNRLLADLKTSHTQVFTQDEPEYYIIADVFGLKNVMPEVWSGPPMLCGIGTFTAKFDGRDHVTQVLEGSPADKAGIKVGDEIVSVDGGPYSPVLAFRGKAGQITQIEIRKTRDGERLRVEVPVALMQPTAAFDQATSNSARVIETNDKRIGYVHLWQMRDKEALSAALELIDSTRSTYGAQQWRRPQSQAETERRQNLKPLDALIIDNRTKIGGAGEVGTHYLEVLTARRGGNVIFSNRHSRRDLRPIPKTFAGRSAMLIDHGTRSAAELFAFGYDSEKIGPLIGTKTAGAVTGGWATLLPGGLLLYLGTSSVLIDGQTIEGVGVKPNIEIARPIPYSNGSDPVLDAAIAHLAKP